MTAMSQDLYRFYLLEKKTSGYVSFDHGELPDTADHSIQVIEDAARTLIQNRLGLPSAVGIKLDVYQPPGPFGNALRPFQLRKTLTQVFDDDYREKCLQFSASDKLGEIELKTYLIIVCSSLELQVFLFGPSNSANTSTYLGSREVIAAVGQTVEVIEEAARKHIKELTRSNVGVSIVRVVEPKPALLEDYKAKNLGLEDHDCKFNDDRKKVVLHGATTPLRAISARDSLIIEFERKQNLFFFEKSGPSYTCLGVFNVSVPNLDETVDEVTKRAMEGLPRSSRYENFTVYWSKENHEGLKIKTTAQVEAEIPLSDGYLRTNAALCAPQKFLQALRSDTLIILFDDQNREQSVEPIHEDSTIERWKIAEAARKRKSPSEDAKPLELQKTQVLTRVDAVYNGRPMDLIASPIQIYHSIFVKFLSRAFLPFDGDDRTLRRTVEFMEASCDCYGDEAARMATLTPILMDLVHINMSSNLKIGLDNQERIEPDATIRAKCNVGLARPVCAFLEVENEIGTGGCDPALRCQSDFVKLCSSSMYQPIVDASCCPVFLLSMAGPTFMVAGAVFANNFIAQRLTDRLSLDPHPTDHEGAIRQVAQVFVAVRECVQDLNTFYSDLKFTKREPDKVKKEQASLKLASSRGSSRSKSQGAGRVADYVPEYPLGRWVFPYRTEFKIGDKTFSLAYDRPLESGVKTTRALFIASMKSPEEEDKLVVVKFARIYCLDAHKLLADLSLAPQLFYHDHMVGVHFVVMEYVEATQVTGEKLKQTEHIESLRRAVQALHDKGLVFGDLRRPNILIAGDSVKIVDFDWSGEEGVVHYPSRISKEIAWPEGVESLGKIEADHDKEWFKELTGTEL